MSEPEFNKPRDGQSFQSPHAVPNFKLGPTTDIQVTYLPENSPLVNDKEFWKQQAINASYFLDELTPEWMTLPTNDDRAGMIQVRTRYRA